MDRHSKVRRSRPLPQQRHYRPPGGPVARGPAGYYKSSASHLAHLPVLLYQQIVRSRLFRRLKRLHLLSLRVGGRGRVGRVGQGRVGQGEGGQGGGGQGGGGARMSDLWGIEVEGSRRRRGGREMRESGWNMCITRENQWSKEDVANWKGVER
eukprot:760845-Hanusia_phi.AAC.8